MIGAIWSLLNLLNTHIYVIHSLFLVFAVMIQQTQKECEKAELSRRPGFFMNSLKLWSPSRFSVTMLVLECDLIWR